MYAKYIKRILDFILSLFAIIVLSLILLIVAILVRIKLGSPVIFKQKRPGLHEKIFTLYKFRTMTDEKDEEGNLLPDEIRLTKFGKLLRSTSLDELPELFNILKGDMAIVGPRPQLVRDMVFMSDEQRKRHMVRQGLTGLAQISGRNNISWEEKLDWDLKYIDKITFLNDVKIIFQTVIKAIMKREGITDGQNATAEDYGDYLLNKGKVSKGEYDQKQKIALKVLKGEFMMLNDNIDIIHNHEPFSVAISVYKNDKAYYFDRALESITDSQKIKPNEIVLVVDGEINEALNNVITKYIMKYNFFKVIRLEKNQGLGNALKIAIENSKYELIARMDSDDVSMPTRFEQQLLIFAQNPQIDIVGGDITEFIGEETNIVARRIVPQKNNDIQQYMKKRCAMNHVTVMYKKSSVQSAGGYLNWFWNEDYYLWIRMWENKMVFVNTGTVLVNVRVGKEMYQRRGGKKYYESEKSLQEYMKKKKLISKKRYLYNVLIRYIVQILFSNRIREIVFRVFARKGDI